MEEAVTIDISRSLAPLREVVGSLSRAVVGDMPKGQERRRLVRRAQLAGASAIPALIRSLSSSSDCEATWGCYLLRRIGSPRTQRTRVIDRLHQMLAGNEVGDDVKARALGLLADLKAPPPRDVVLRNPGALLDSSVRDLLGSLCTKAELRQAVDLILEQVPRDEITNFVSQVINHGGDSALPLLDSLIVDSRTPQTLLPELHEMRSREPQQRSPQDSTMLERALNQLSQGKPQRARKWLELLAAAHPEDPEIRSALGVCLLELNQPEPAVLHLQKAAVLEPGSALHKWNLAAAARAADRMGTCYQTLHEYVRTRDEEAGNEDRLREARAFCRAYETMLQDAYPGVALSRVLEGEELFARAYAALSASRYDEAMTSFHEVLQLVPRHYPSWGNLGAAYLAMDRMDEAVQCLRRALELNPNYSIARDNLALIHQSEQAGRR